MTSGIIEKYGDDMIIRSVLLVKWI